MSNTERYTIRAFKLQDKPALFSLMFEIWPHASPALLENRWWWNYDPAPILLVIDNEVDALVGMCAFIPFQLYHQGSNYSSAWYVDFYLLPAHQRQGLGTRLTKEISNRYEIVASLSQSDAAWATLRRQGWHERSYAPLFLSPWLSLMRPFSWILPPAQGKNGFEITIHESSSWQFDKSFDDLWLRSCETVAPSAVRDASALQQRYANDTKRHYIILKCTNQAVLVGYMILRILPPHSFKALSKFRIGLIVDYLVDDNPLVFPQLLSTATSWFAKSGVPLMLCISNRQADQTRLRRRGFINPETPFIGRKLQNLAVGFTFVSSSGQSSLGEQPWHLTLGDCDVDLIWGSEHLNVTTPEG